jgi:hypothetical protein
MKKLARGNGLAYFVPQSSNICKARAYLSGAPFWSLPMGRLLALLESIRQAFKKFALHKHSGLFSRKSSEDWWGEVRPKHTQVEHLSTPCPLFG